jgi:two-component system sensor histidine kinase CiaH
MLQKARIKLTLLYSAIFLLLFWSLSFGIYAWMDQFFGDHGRIHFIEISQNEPQSNPGIHTEPPSDIIMDNLRNIIFVIDGLLLLTIPGVSWVLTGNALEPVQKAHNRERQFLADASHELRTPLSILRAEMEVVLKKPQTDTEYQKIIKSNKEEVEGLIALTENLLFMSRERTNHSSPINETIDLTDLLAEQVANFKLKADQKNLKLLLYPPEKEILILGNQLLLKRLFINLLDNAVKYTPKGKIGIAVKKTKIHALIIINDTGIGIAQNHQEKIFNRFYRADESRTKKGYGLGLSIAKQIVAVHEGKIVIKSAPAKGTSVQITFPLIDQIKPIQGKNLS